MSTTDTENNQSNRLFDVEDIKWLIFGWVVTLIFAGFVCYYIGHKNGENHVKNEVKQWVHDMEQCSDSRFINCPLTGGINE